MADAVDLEVQLFRRAGNSMFLTDAGQAFLPGLRAGFAELERAMDALREHDSRGPLVLSVAPIQALREGAVAPGSSLRRRAIVGSILLAGGIAALAAGLFGGLSNAAPIVGTGAYLTFIGVAVLSPFVARPLASVLGARFDAPALAAVLDLPPERVLQLLSEARRAHLLDPQGDPPTRYEFHHALIRHALYEELDDAELVHWHGRVGDYLVALAGADLATHADAIASHYFAALAGGETTRAIAACTGAAAQAHRLFAYERSARWYERALQALDNGRCEEALSLLEDLARAQPESKKRKRTYGMNYVDYLPHYALGRAQAVVCGCMDRRGSDLLPRRRNPTIRSLICAVKGGERLCRARVREPAPDPITDIPLTTPLNVSYRQLG